MINPGDRIGFYLYPPSGKREFQTAIVQSVRGGFVYVDGAVLLLGDVLPPF